jgi:hypothetical protein
MNQEGECNKRVGSFSEVATFIATMQGGVEERRERRERIRLRSEAESMPKSKALGQELMTMMMMMGK